MDFMNKDLRWQKICNCVNTSCQLSDLNFLIGIISMFPMVTILNREKSGIVRADGALIEITNFVFGSLNVPYNFVSPKKSAQQKYDIFPNGTWTGHLGKLLNKEFDFFMGVEVIDFERHNSFVTLESYVTNALAMLGSVQQMRHDNFFRFLLTVDYSVWIYLMGTFACLVLTSSIMDFYHFNGKENFRVLTSHYFWVYLAALFCEGTSRTPVTRRNQGLLITWLYCILIFSCAVSGQFRAAIMMTKNDDDVRTVQDVADRPHLMPYLLKKSHAEAAFSLSSLPHYQKLYTRALKNPKEGFLTIHQVTSPDTFQKVKDGKGLLVAPPVLLQTMLSIFCDRLKGPRKFYQLDETFMPDYYTMLANRDMPTYLTRKINFRFLSYREGGFINQILVQYQKNYDKCIRADDESTDQIHLLFIHLASVFILLAGCHAFAFAVLVGEIVVFKISKRYSQPTIWSKENSVNQFERLTSFPPSTSEFLNF